MQAYTLYAENVPRAVSQIRHNLRTPMPRTFVDVGVTVFGGLASFMEDDVPKVFAEVGDEELRERFESANRASAESMRELEQWIQAQGSSATDAFALGADLFAEMLIDTEGVDIPLARLTAIGEEDLERKFGPAQERLRETGPGALHSRMPGDRERSEADRGSRTRCP